MCRRFRSWRRIWLFRWKTRGFTNNWHGTKRDWSATYRRRREFRVRCCGPCRPKTTAWIWRPGSHRNHEEPGTAETAACGNAETNEPTGGRAAHRRAIHDRVLCHLAESPAKASGSQRRTITAAAVQGRALRQDRIDRISAGYLRRSEL